MRNVLFALMVAVTLPLSGTSPADDLRPNVLMIVVDDLRHDEFGAGGHPYLETPNIDRLAVEGAQFSNAYHVTPLCSPNRASLLTGQYVSRHGILDNTSRSYASHRLDLFPKELRRAGYTTAHIGKWHMGNDPTPRPGYDYWVSYAGQGKTYDPELYENGRTHQVKGYITDILTDRTIDFIEHAGDQPFFAYIGHKAVHPEAGQNDDGSVDFNIGFTFIPAERHAGRYEDRSITRSPNYSFSEADREAKPVLRDSLAFKHSAAIEDRFGGMLDNGVAENTIRRRAEMVLAVDEGLGRIIDTLEKKDVLDNTLIVFTSDNGYFYGEHGLSVERRLPYEESVKTPLLVRYPPLVKPKRQIDALAVSIDLAPTILDVVGVEIPAHVQGTSLAPVLTGEADKVHDAILMEYYSHENPFYWTVNMDYRTVRMGNYKYIRWIRFDNEAELYDLKQDPFEQNNLIGDPAMTGIINRMQNELRNLVIESLGLE